MNSSILWVKDTQAPDGVCVAKDLAEFLRRALDSKGHTPSRATRRPRGVEWPWKPPGSCIPENGLGLGSLVDV